MKKLFKLVTLCFVNAGYNITSCTVYGKATLSNGDECVQSFTVRN